MAALIDENTGDRWGALECLIGDRLQLKEVPLAIATVGGDQHFCGRVIDAIGKCVCWEAAEDNAVGCAEPSAGEHGDRHLRDHRHVDGDAVAFRYAESLQRVRGLLHLAEQVVVGNGSAVARLADPVEGHLLTATGSNVAIDTILGNVQFAVIKPLRKGKLPLQGFGEGLPPGQQLACLLSPEGNRIGGGTLVEIGAGICCCGGCRVGWEGEPLSLEGFDPVLLWRVAH